jgi:hypothetical protein
MVESRYEIFTFIENLEGRECIYCVTGTVE